jgi:CcmD family protein
MAAYWPVFLVLSVAWIGFVGYMLLLGRRSSRLARSISDTGAER